MGHISFNPAAKSIYLRLKVDSINADTTRDILVALDTGASTTMIPTEVAIDLGYNLSNLNEQIMTATELSGQIVSLCVNSQQLVKRLRILMLCATIYPKVQ